MRREQLRRAGDIVVASVALVAGWQALSLLIGTRYLPAPGQTLARIATAFGQRAFLDDLSATGGAYAIALAIAMAGGVVLGLVSGGSRAAGDMVGPVMHTIVALPKVTLYPVILLLFGLGDTAKVAFGILHGLPTVTIMTADAIRVLKPIFGKTARAMRLTRHDYALHVLLPAVLPQVLASLRICFALTLLGVLVGEMFASTHGLGHLLMASIGVDDMPTVMAIIVVLFLFAGFGSAGLLAAIDRLKR
jgi:NitT/TauT family transport system permease protein